MKYVSEAIYRLTAWLEPEVAEEMGHEFDLDDYRAVTIDGREAIEVVFETADVDERDRAVAWLETRK